MKEAAEIVIKIAAVLTALGVIGGLIYKIVAFVQHQKEQDAEIEALKERVAVENTLICYGLSACLDGLVQLGCNHTVPDAKNKLDKYLYQQAHR